jgi:hypothetical protein
MTNPSAIGLLERAPRSNCRKFPRPAALGFGLYGGDSLGRLRHRIQVQVIFADPRQGMIRFQEVLATSAEEPTKGSVEESSEELVEELSE